MSLLFTVLVSLAIYCFWMGGEYIYVGLICLLGLSRKVGWLAQLLAVCYLYYKRHWIAGFIPLVLLALFILGWFQRRGDKLWQVTGKYAMRDLIPSLIRYTRAYLKAHLGLSAAKAEDLVLDPQMGKEIDRLVDGWCSGTPGPAVGYETSDLIEAEPEDRAEYVVKAVQALTSLDFEAAEVADLNKILDKYAGMFPPEAQEAGKFPPDGQSS